MDNATATVVAEPGRRAGRPLNEHSSRAIARNTRWWLTHTFTDLSMAVIAGAERKPTSPSTVSRGIAEAEGRIGGSERLKQAISAILGA
jgi:hypothetical protein